MSQPDTDLANPMPGRPLVEVADASAPLVILLDVDNTLLDNDRFGADLDARLVESFGAIEQQRYRSIYERLRAEFGYADYLGALQRLRTDLNDDPELLRMSGFLLEYPFEQRLYPEVMQVLAHLRALAPTVILSDGDVVFQPHKIQRAGLWDALAGRVLIGVHKELMSSAVQRLYPAKHYAMVDDKPELLVRMKSVWGDALTTVFVEQGHYAAKAAGQGMTADRHIGAIGELLDVDADFFDAPTATAPSVSF